MFNVNKKYMFCTKTYSDYQCVPVKEDMWQCWCDGREVEVISRYSGRVKLGEASGEPKYIEVTPHWCRRVY